MLRRNAASYYLGAELTTAGIVSTLAQLKAVCWTHTLKLYLISDFGIECRIERLVPGVRHRRNPAYRPLGSKKLCDALSIPPDRHAVHYRRVEQEIRG